MAPDLAPSYEALYSHYSHARRQVQGEWLAQLVRHAAGLVLPKGNMGKRAAIQSPSKSVADLRSISTLKSLNSERPQDVKSYPF